MTFYKTTFAVLLSIHILTYTVLAADDYERKQNQLQEAITERSSREKEYEEAKTSLAKLESSLQEKEESLETKNNDLDETKKYSTSRRHPGWSARLDRKRTNLVEDVDTLESEIKDLKKEITSAKRAVSKTKSMVNSINSQIQMYEKQLANLEERRADELKNEHQKAQFTLATSPDDQHAHGIMGTYILFTEENWDKAIPHIAKSDLAKLRPLAETELRNPTSSKGIIMLGKAYKQVGDDESDVTRRKLLHKRAAYWFRKILPTIPAAKRDSFEARILKLEE